MPDITTDILGGELEWLTPGEDLLEYDHDQMRIHTPKQLESAIAEFKIHAAQWCKAGLLAESIFRSGLWRRGRTRKWSDWCAETLGYTGWYVKKLRQAAAIVLDLARRGFQILPRCVAQCEPLFSIRDGELLSEVWSTVLENLAESELTKGAIAQVVCACTGKRTEVRHTISLKSKIWDALREEAMRRGQTPERVIEDWLGLSEPDSPAPEDVERDRDPEPSQKPKPKRVNRLRRWWRDVEELVKEHEGSRGDAQQGCNSS
jgi:hypothetical protein